MTLAQIAWVVYGVLLCVTGTVLVCLHHPVPGGVLIGFSIFGFVALTGMIASDRRDRGTGPAPGG